MGGGGETMKASPLVNYHRYIKRDLVLKVFLRQAWQVLKYYKMNMLISGLGVNTI